MKRARQRRASILQSSIAACHVLLFILFFLVPGALGAAALAHQVGNLFEHPATISADSSCAAVRTIASKTFDEGTTRRSTCFPAFSASAMTRLKRSCS